MRIFENTIHKKKVTFSNRSIFQLANKFRNKSNRRLDIDNSHKNIVDIIREAPSPYTDGNPKTESMNMKQPVNSLQRVATDNQLIYNLNYSSSDSMNESDDDENRADDVFVSKEEMKMKGIDGELITAIK